MVQGNNDTKRFFGIMVQITPERRQAVYGEVSGLSTPSPAFYAMVVISSIIAAYGLLANSTAVVIGAMLVAPLMGPIFGMALGLSAGDRRLLGHASRSEALGIPLAVVIGLLVGLIPWQPEFGSEILGRTQPTIYDIVIALASAVAGTYALVDERISPALPGVAIATALVPPLVTCGLCLAVGEWQWALGALLLFTANFLAIEIAAALVFVGFGMTTIQVTEALTFTRFMRRFGLSLAALAVIALFMTHTLVTLITERRQARVMENTLSQELRTTIGARLSDFRHSRQGDTINAVATVLTPQAFEPVQVQRLEDALRRELDAPVTLVLRSVLSHDVDRTGPVFVAEKERKRRQQAVEQTQFITRTSQVLTEQLKAVSGARLIEIRREQEDDKTVVRAVVRTPTVVTPAQVARLEEALRHAVDTPLRLVVRSVPIRVADAQRYLFEMNHVAQPLTGEALALHRRLEMLLTQQLAQLDGASLLELRYTAQEDGLRVLAVVRTPRNFVPEQVQHLEAALQQQVHPYTTLIVRSVVGTDTATTGHLVGFDDTQWLPDAHQTDSYQKPH